jgi:hypothetical protein
MLLELLLQEGTADDESIIRDHELMLQDEEVILEEPFVVRMW